MTGKGYEKIGDGVYFHPSKKLLVHDLFPRNVSESGGTVHPIDSVIQHATPEFAYFMKHNPGPWNDFKIHNRLGTPDSLDSTDLAAALRDTLQPLLDHLEKIADSRNLRARFGSCCRR